jgi:hypothetical protein
MRRLLIVVIVLGATILLAQADSGQALGPYDTHLYLYHPTGSWGGSTMQGYLTCGWHGGCDGVTNPPGELKEGLNWFPPQDGSLGTKQDLPCRRALDEYVDSTRTN